MTLSARLAVSSLFACVILLGATPAAAPRPIDLSVWPNAVSYRNSDPWLAENHDRIRSLRPRVLVLNFANDVDMAGIRDRTERLIAAIAESTRYHGFENPDAPAFLRYDVVKYVDLRDPQPPAGLEHGNSTLFPQKRAPSPDVLCDYGRFYSDAFAKRLGFPDPQRPGRFMNLHRLIETGTIHEMWFYAIHNDVWPGLETIEDKQHYNAEGRAISGEHGPAGNGHDDTMPWSGRSFRIAFFNPHRGIGCAMENFGHTLQHIAISRAIPNYTRYFEEFAELDLDRRFGRPFDSLYSLDRDKDWVDYLDDGSIVIHRGGKEYRIPHYVAKGGNVHFPPGARRHYDLASPYTVSSTIEGWRRREGPGGSDTVRPFGREKWARYKMVAPDCMGPWLVFWRQCMPGLDNPSRDDDGRPMKNWWVYLFY